MLGLTPNSELHFANLANLNSTRKGILGKAVLSFTGEQRCKLTPQPSTAILGPHLVSRGTEVGKVAGSYVSLAGPLSGPPPALHMVNTDTGQPGGPSRGPGAKVDALGVGDDSEKCGSPQRLLGGVLGSNSQKGKGAGRPGTSRLAVRHWASMSPSLP